MTGNMDCFSDLLRMRRSIRDFQDSDVPLEVVTAIINDSTLAPSASNGQPWNFIIVRDKGLIRKMSDESKKNLLAHIEADPNDSTKMYEGMLRNESVNVFHNAPCLVLILGEKTCRSVSVDCALAASYFMMSATARGLGTCWVQLGAYIYDRGMLEELGIPDDCEIVAPLILGYPKKIPAAATRKPPEILKSIG